MRRSVARVLALLCTQILIAGVFVVSPAAAHGLVDQQLTGDPECTTDNFPSSVPLETAVTQTFVPARGGLLGLDLCTNVLLGQLVEGSLPGFDVSIVDTTTEEVLASQSVSVPLTDLGTKYRHVDLDGLGPVAVTPGHEYRIEVSSLQLLMAVRATCGGTGDACTASDPDLYPAGSGDPVAPGDFGFRTYAVDAADLGVSIDAPSLVCPHPEALDGTEITVRNEGSVALGSTEVELAIGPGATPGPSDHVLGRATVADLPVGASRTLTPADFGWPETGPLPTGTVHLVATVDPDDEVQEVDETDQQAVVTTTATPCAPSSLSDLELTVGDGAGIPDLPAGIVDIPLVDLPPTAIAAGAEDLSEVTSTPVHSTPVHSTPVYSTPVYSTPVYSTPVYSTPVHSTPVYSTPVYSTPVHSTPTDATRLGVLLRTAPADVLDRVPLASVPVVPGWYELIADYPQQANVTDQGAAQADAEALLAKTLQDLTLADVFVGLQPALDVGIHQANLNAALPMSQLAVAYASQPFASFPAPTCSEIAAISHLDCAADGIDPTESTFLTLDLLGYPMNQIDLRGALVADLGLRDDAPIAAVRLADDELGAVAGDPSLAVPYRLAPTSLGALTVDDALTDPSIVRCSALPSPCGEATLAAVEEAFAFRTGATLGELVDLLTPEAAAGFDVAQSLLGLYSIGDLPWGRFDVDALDLPSLSECPATTYRLEADSTGAAPVVDPTLKVRLPRGFDPVDGTAEVAVDGGAPTALDDPTSVEENGRRLLSFAVEALVADSVVITFDACASTTLGVVGSDADAAWVSFAGVDDPNRVARSTVDPPVDVAHLRVVEREEPDSPDDARTIPPDTLVLRHVAEPDDLDHFRIPLSVPLDEAGTTVEPGDILRIKLSPPPARPGPDGDMVDGHDYDLAAFGPPSPLRDAPVHSTGVREGDPIVPIADRGGAEGDPYGSTPPDALAETPVYSTPVYSTPVFSTGPREVSVQRGDRPEVIDLQVGPQETGDYVVQVSGTNGDSSPRQYVLSYQVLKPILPEILESCPAPGDFDATSVTGALQSVPGGATSLILWNETLFATTHGSEAAADVGAKLADLAAHPKVNGAVVAYERDPAAAAAVEQWRSHGWCDPVDANRVVGAVRGVMADAIADAPGIENVVIIGGDDQTPMLRSHDGTLMANERAYLETLVSTLGVNSPAIAAAWHGLLLSDGGYGTAQPLKWMDDTLYVPDHAVGRLLDESAQDVSLAIDQFLLSQGQLDLDTGALAGYGFLSDGAAAAAQALQSGLGVSTDTTLVGDGWTAADLAGTLRSTTPDIAGLHAHADHHRLLSASGDVTGTLDVLTTAEDVPFGQVVFSAGCHFGTNVIDRHAAAGSAGDASQLDWAQRLTRESALVYANTGFGYGHTDEVGLSERLMLEFVRGLASERTVGLADVAAKQRYVATMGAYGEHDRKVIHEATLYGLPMYEVVDGDQGSPAATTPTITADPLTGLEVAALDTGSLPAGPSCTGTCLRQFTATGGSSGTYHDLVGPGLQGDPLAIEGTPKVPQATWSLDVGGRETGGFLITGTSSIDVPGPSGPSSFDPVFVRPIVSDASQEQELQALDTAWPGAPAATHDIGGRSWVNVPLATFRGESVRGDGEVVGSYRLDTRVQGLVYLRDTSGPDPDRAAPAIRDVDVRLVERSGDDLLAVTLRAVDESDVGRAIVSLRTSVGWRFVELDRSSSTTESLVGGGQIVHSTWQGATTLPSGATVDTVRSQAVDQRGNVGSTLNKLLPPALRTTSDTDPELEVTGAIVDGWYVDGATIRIVGGSSEVYDVTVGGVLIGTLRLGDTFTVAQTGVHRVVVTGSADTDGLGTVVDVAVDVSPPSITFVSPPETDVSDPDGFAVEHGAVVPLEISCRDAGSGVDPAACVVEDADGQLDTHPAGEHTLTVRATDRVGNVTTRTITYEVLPRYEIVGFDSPVPPAPQIYEVNAGSTIPFKFRVFEDGVEQTSTSVLDVATWRQVSCADPMDQSQWGSPSLAKSAPTFRYADGFIFNATTDKKWKGTCRMFTVTLTDGTSLSAVVRML